MCREEIPVVDMLVTKKAKVITFAFEKEVERLGTLRVMYVG